MSGLPRLIERPAPAWMRFVVTLGKPVVIQSDQNGDVTLSVKRQEN